MRTLRAKTEHVLITRLIHSSAQVKKRRQAESFPEIGYEILLYQAKVGKRWQAGKIHKPGQKRSPLNSLLLRQISPYKRLVAHSRLHCLQRPPQTAVSHLLGS